MWISVFDIKRDVTNFAENFENSSFKKELLKFGDFKFEWKYGILSEFRFFYNERTIELRFLYSFSERRMELMMKDTSFEDIGVPKFEWVENGLRMSHEKIHDGFENIHQVLFSEFKKWMESIHLDCLLYVSRNGGIVPEKERFCIASNRDNEVMTYTGEESKKIISLMREFPIRYRMNDKENYYYTDLNRVFSGASFIVTYSFYPKPCVDIIYGDHEFCYQTDLLDMFTLKRCFSIDDIKEFHTWCDGFALDTKKAAEKLYNSLNIFPSESIDLEDDVVTIDGEYEFKIMPVASGFEFKYDVFSPNLNEATVDTVDEAILLCINDRNTILLLQEAGDELFDYVSGFKPTMIEHGTKSSSITGAAEMYGKKIDWKLSFQFERKTSNLTFGYYFSDTKTEEKEILTMEEAKDKLQNEIYQFIKRNRVRSVFSEKDNVV